ncbi:MAG: tyrosine-type recombinase/integrase [Gammaproteobacteria bacterium]
MSEACTRFLEHCRHSRKLSHHTLRAYERDLEEFQHFAPPSKPLADCDKNLLREYIRYLFETRELKATSVKRRLACLKAMFRWFEEDEVISTTPFRTLSTPIKLPARLPRGLSRSELRRLLNAPGRSMGCGRSARCSVEELIELAGDRHGFVQLTTLLTLELLFATGMRIGELASVSLPDIDLNEACIRIHGKGDRERIVYLPDSRIRDLVRAYMSTRHTREPGHDGLLITTRGRAADTQYLRLLVRRAGEAARLERRITPHMLRHSAATHLLSAGADIRYVQRLLGHQSITTTQIYTQVSDQMLKKVVCKTHPIRKIVGE